MSSNAIPTFSFWEKQFYSKSDFVIVGNGIVGLQCAIHLKDKYPHREVWVVDRAPASLGASMRNAGFACFGSMGEILDDTKNTNAQNAYALYEKRFKGIGLLKQDFGETEIGYEKTGGYEIFEKENQSELDAILLKIEEINQALEPITGEKPFQPKPTAKLGMQVLETGIFTPHEGALQTHLLYNRIYTKCIEKGIKIFGGITVTGFEALPKKHWKILNAEGYPLQTKNAIICTNGFTKTLFPEIEVNPARGQILVTSPIPGLAWRGLMHADKGYIYFRSLGTRILIGGARNMDFINETTTDLNISDPIYNRLVQFLREIVVPNEPFEITDTWAGTMGMAADRTPIVRQIHPGMFACVRMGGMGVALSAVVSRELASLASD